MTYSKDPIIEAEDPIAIQAASEAVAIATELGVLVNRADPSTEGGVLLSFFGRTSYKAYLEFYNDGEAIKITYSPGDEPQVSALLMQPSAIQEAIAEAAGSLRG